MIDIDRIREIEIFSHEIGAVQGGMIRDLIAEVRALRAKLAEAEEQRKNAEEREDTVEASFRKAMEKLAAAEKRASDADSHADAEAKLHDEARVELEATKKRLADAEKHVQEFAAQYATMAELHAQAEKRAKAWEDWWIKSWDCSRSPGHPGAPTA